MKVEEQTVDDLLNKTLTRLLSKPKSSRHLRGTAQEEIGALLVLKNPLARLSRSESRSTLFSCLGETLWYLDGSDSIERISYYIPSYPRMVEVDDTVKVAPGAYGPRVFGSGENAQFERIATLLSNRDRRSTRKAVIQVYDKSDLLVHMNDKETGNDVPCTVSLQFFVRANRLHLMVHMRSNDAYVGLPHDVFAFTFIQELMARRINVPIGRYIQSVGSLHLYEGNQDQARNYIGEGLLTPVPMPSMPVGDPRVGLNWLMKQERSLRAGETKLTNENEVEPYWRDLGRILLLKRLYENQDATQYSGVAHQIESEFFRTFVDEQRLKMSAPERDQFELPIR